MGIQSAMLKLWHDAAMKGIHREKHNKESLQCDRRLGYSFGHIKISVMYGVVGFLSHILDSF